nr:hypothetical protein [Maridesulfovibrio hydrothermalis]
MAKITKMPGRMCRYYQSGKCFYEEMLNPGYNKEWRCKVLRDLEGEYDKLLRQAEAFKLDADAFSDLWEQRIEEHLKSGAVCRKMVSHEDEDEDSPFCAAVCDEVCLFEMPECDGICSSFKPVNE